MSLPYFAAERLRSAKRNLTWLRTRFYRDSNKDSSKSIFVCGAGRSGTTWLVEVLNSSNELRMLYEPFNCDRVRRCKHFQSRQYLRPDVSDRAYLEPAREIFTGTIRDPWIDQFNRCKNASARLIKDVRSTLMLKWIRNNFPHMPIVFIIRHPCAVALSRVDYGWPTDLRERVFSPQKQLMEDHIGDRLAQISWANSPFQRQVADWCVETFVPLEQLADSDAYVVFYERLMADPAGELRKLFDFLGRRFDESALERLDRQSASSKVRRGNLGVERARQRGLNGWRRHVSTADLEAAIEIMRVFGLDGIYGDDSQPDSARVKAMLAKAAAGA